MSTDTPPDDRELIAALGRSILTDVAPAELPLYPSVVKARQAGAQPAKAGKAGDDLLGFGPGEAVVLLAPVVLEFAHQVWAALSDEAVGATASGIAGVFRRLRDRFVSGGSPHPEQEPTLTVEQLQHVRRVGNECAGHLPIPAEQRRLMVESLVAALAVPN